MNYSQFTDEELKERIKGIRLQTEILDRMETEIMYELADRECKTLEEKLYQELNRKIDPKHVKIIY